MDYSNMMPGDNSGAEPDEHDRECRTQCEHAEAWERDEDRALDVLRGLATASTWWAAPFGMQESETVKHELGVALGCLECPEGHDDHECTCESIAESYAEDQARAWAERNPL